ncbi:aminopyrimidine aminohydrolase [Sphaerisporangium melleum]|uniref:Aminopyrimidine aminohydrolase n=1 Tax=Sphaerisporangium melleum TaxID=321316 RepID=A0A917RDR0_9ACTN|nr:thiaminase II [Sphaerisporangium melleum]GGL03378.1 aminopyrimidine aminohydrolase [Sphaerisporangium melleum]GII74069.1 aminopyrimidine aminohydrolase [Sphaerisporangium melleum]
MTTPGSSTARPYSEELWEAITPIHKAILDHPFITGLVDGTLPRAAFRHFIVQDSHYLRDYARALALCAAKAPGEEDVRAFASDAVGAIAAEQEMHAAFMADLGGSAGEAAALPVGPATRAYTSYLLATVYGGSFLDGLAAVLPCYWIYARVGAELLAESSPDPLYRRWIAAYGDESFQSVVRRVVSLADRTGAEATGAQRAHALGHFVTTSRYEWMFWDAAWREETWPV